MNGQKFLAAFLILIIIGGLGYIVYSNFFMRHSGIGIRQNVETPQNSPAPNSNMSNMNMNMAQQSQPNYTANSQAAVNKDDLNKATTIINQALDLITIDPYSKTTVPNTTLSAIISGQSQTVQGANGTINIYPSANSAVNINPTPNGNGATTEKSNPFSPGLNFVFDQGKLYQLHNRIFLLAQGMMQLDELNTALSNQAATVEINPPNYNTFLNRYNLAVSNKSKLSDAINTLNQAFSLINLNPYAAPNGFQYNVQNMEQLHQGIYKLAQGLAGLNRLNDQFTRQIAEASYQAQSLTNMNSMSMPSNSLFDPNTLISVLVIIVIIVLLLSIFVAIRKAIKSNGSGKPPAELEDKK